MLDLWIAAGCPGVPVSGHQARNTDRLARGNSARPSGQDSSARLTDGFASQGAPTSQAGRPHPPAPQPATQHKPGRNAAAAPPPQPPARPRFSRDATIPPDEMANCEDPDNSIPVAASGGGPAVPDRPVLHGSSGKSRKPQRSTERRFNARVASRGRYPPYSLRIGLGWRKDPGSMSAGHSHVSTADVAFYERRARMWRNSGILCHLSAGLGSPTSRIRSMRNPASARASV